MGTQHFRLKNSTQGLRLGWLLPRFSLKDKDAVSPFPLFPVPPFPPCPSPPFSRFCWHILVVTPAETAIAMSLDFFTSFPGSSLGTHRLGGSAFPESPAITRLRPAQPMTRTRYRFGEDYYSHFMTNTVVVWLPVFSYPCFAEVIFDSWQFLQRERDIKILAYVLMENHAHWIAVGPLLSKRVGEFKSHTATTIIQRMEAKKYQTLLQELKYYKLRHKIDQTYQLWQEGSHPQCLESENVLRQKIEYTHYNPVRRGYVDDPVHWRYSSARQYAGQPGLLEVYTDGL